MKKLLTLFVWSIHAQINENCDSLEVGQQCEDDCVDIFAKCAVDCKSDSTCIVECNRELARCSTDCPCHANCEDGCPCDFISDYCNECKMEPINQAEYKKCADKATIELLTCDQECEAFDDNCLTKCTDEFNTAIGHCPCMVNCADGCPCETYYCEQTPTAEPPPPVINNDVHLLVLDGKLNMNKFSMEFRPPMVFDSINKLDNFQLDPEFNAVEATCSVLFKGQMQVATSGNVNFYRMSSGNTLTKVPFLNGEISTKYPLCSMVTDNTMVMCATDPDLHDGMYNCHMLLLDDKAVNYNWAIQGTTFSHQLGSMNQHNDDVFIFGGRRGDDDNELISMGFTLQSAMWTQVVDGSAILPDGIAGHSSVSFNNELLVFGGYWTRDTPSNIVFRVVDGQLKFYEDSMLSSRSMHRTISQGNSLVHIGDASKRNSSTIEVWQWNGNKFDIFTSHSHLITGDNYVEVIPIDAEDYEDDITKEDFDLAIFVQSPASTDWNHNNSPRIGLTCQFSVTETGLSQKYLIEDVVPNAFTEIDYMCGYRVKNRFFLAGSKNYELSAQRWELTPTGWTRRPNLPFGFDEGRCIEFDEDRALLCSAYLKGKKCALVDHTDWGYTNTADTQHDHYGGELVKYNSTQMIISSTQSRWVELLNKDSLTWSPINEVPAKFKRFSAVNLNTFVYIFGNIKRM